MSMLDRIVILHDNIEARGGATGLARLAALEYRKLGLEVTYLTGADDDGSLLLAGVETHGLGQKNLMQTGRLTALQKGVHNGEAARFVSDWISENDTPRTAYHLHNWSQILSPSIFDALKRVEERVVVSCHDFFNACPNGGLLHFRKGEVCTLKPMSAACWASQCDRRSPLHKYWRMMRHMNLHRAARFSQSRMLFVCLHEGMSAVMREAGFAAPRLTSIPNPATPMTSEPIKAEQNADFIFLGRINREKGADIAAAAAAMAGVRLVMMGEGDLLEPLSRQHPDVVFTGFCDRAAIELHARKARALIVPGRWREPFGLVIAEAAMSGLPVIISQPSTLAGQVEALEMGVTFDPASVDALATHMNNFAADDDLVARLSQNAYDHADRLCSTPESWAKQFVNLLEEQVTLAS